jgi:alcohol dehydrogenase class IV
MSALRAFSAPTRIVAGLGAVQRLGPELEALGARRVAVVCDEGVANAGLLDGILATIPPEAIVLLPLVRPDPLVGDVETAAEAARAEDCDAVIGIGGGSALALSKAVALLLRNESPITDYAGWDKAPLAPVPSIAIPTTAGSGSEVSNALVLHDPQQESIVVVRGHGYEPRVAILDGALLRTLPRGPLVEAALDALSHAVEALSVRGASMFTDALAVAAADHLHETLPRVLEERADDDLQRLLEASAMANLACGSSGLGLVHALSSGTRLRAPHGRANGVLLPWVAAFNRGTLGARALAETERILPLYERIGFEPSLRPGDLAEEDLPSVIGVALDSPLHHNNSRHATAGELEEILVSAGAQVRGHRV